jgi:hypothetical protein
MSSIDVLETELRTYFIIKYSEIFKFYYYTKHLVNLKNDTRPSKYS